MDINGMVFEKDGDVGIVMIRPSQNGNGSAYDPKLALQSIREKVQSDASIKLVFITGEGNRAALLREIFEIDEKMSHLWLRRMKRKRKRCRNIRKERRLLTHAASLLTM
jgi:hypothetical protein